MFGAGSTGARGMGLAFSLKRALMASRGLGLALGITSFLDAEIADWGNMAIEQCTSATGKDVRHMLRCKRSSVRDVEG
jgi:hypothetical protein